MQEKALDPVSAEASKYDRDLKMLEMFKPVIITSAERHILRSVAISYGILDPVLEKTFYDVRGKLMAEIFRRLKELSSTVLDKERESDLGKVPVIPSKAKPDRRLSDKWGVEK